MALAILGMFGTDIAFKEGYKRGQRDADLWYEHNYSTIISAPTTGNNCLADSPDSSGYPYWTPCTPDVPTQDTNPRHPWTCYDGVHHPWPARVDPKGAVTYFEEDAK
jgi:hypothetical protein